MPTVAKPPSGSWCAWVRREDTVRPSHLAELSVDRNETRGNWGIGRLTKVSNLGLLQFFTSITHRHGGRTSKKAQGRVPLCWLLKPLFTDGLDLAPPLSVPTSRV